MKLQRLEILHLPGIDAPFSIEDLGDGLTVILGPNAIGKSSLCRAMKALLWKDGAQGAQVIASALFKSEGHEWLVEREFGSWTWRCDGVKSEPPRLPAEHLADCFFLGLRQLLDPALNAGNDVARAIREQMSGGFDLTSAASSFATVSILRAGKKARTVYIAAEGEVRRAEQQQVGLARRETSLAQLDGEIAASEDARSTRDHVQRALELHEQREKLEECRSNLAALPAVLEHLTGKESQEIEDRERELKGETASRSTTERAIETSQKQAEDTRLTKPVGGALLDTARKRADTLAEVERDRSRALLDHGEAKAAVAGASRRVGGHTDAPVELDLPEDAELFAFLRDSKSVHEKQMAIDERLQLLDQQTFSAEDAEQLKQLRRGTEQLRVWLRSPAESIAPGSGEPGPVRMLVAIAAVLAVVGIALGLTVTPSLFAVASLGLGLGIAAWLLRTHRAPKAPVVDARVFAQREYPQDLEQPSAWMTEAVRDRLRGLEDELACLQAEQQSRDRRDGDREKLENQSKGLDLERCKIAERREQLVQKLELKEILPDAELVDMARALDRLRAAHERDEKAAGKLQVLEERRKRLIDDLTTILTDHAEAAATDAESARAGVDHLVKRDQALSDALAQQKASKQQLLDLDTRIAGIKKTLGAVYDRAGLEVDDSAGLSLLLHQLEPYQKLFSERGGLSRAIDLSEKHLRDASQESLAEWDEAHLQRELKRIDDLQAGLGKLYSERADILAEVRDARKGHTLESALAARDGTLELLDAQRERALYAAAGQFFVDSVRSEHDTNQMPLVLKRACELFGMFTHHDFELEIAPEGGASFFAIEARTGQRRELDELSDGTRVQLALAARLAFAGEAEQDLRLPLFLDEALDHSDAGRFQAIARSLARMTKEGGRQIFYLTSDEQDVQRIQMALRQEGCELAKVIDLAVVRKQKREVRDPRELTVPPLPTVPGPQGMTAEEYGAALSIPGFDPRRGPLDQHLYYLLSDDLPLLHRLLQNRIERVGQWLALSRSGAPLASKIVSAAGTGEQLGFRVDLLEAFCQAWAEGRGMPVGRQAIEASQALSDKYLEAAVRIANESQGDGVTLLRVLRKRGHPDLKGFHTKQTDPLEDYLSAEGYIDERTILDESGVTARVLATPAAGRLSEEVTPRLVHEWWSLSQTPPTAQVGPGVEEDPSTSLDAGSR